MIFVSILEDLDGTGYVEYEQQDEEKQAIPALTENLFMHIAVITVRFLSPHIILTGNFHTCPYIRGEASLAMALERLDISQWLPQAITVFEPPLSKPSAGIDPTFGFLEKLPSLQALIHTIPSPNLLDGMIIDRMGSGKNGSIMMDAYETYWRKTDRALRHREVQRVVAYFTGGKERHLHCGLGKLRHRKLEIPEVCEPGKCTFQERWYTPVERMYRELPMAQEIQTKDAEVC